MSWADRVLLHPLARGRDLDDPSTTAIRREIIASKPFLQAIYRDWYGAMARHVTPDLRPIVEIGAGAGISRDVFPGVFRSDIMLVPGLDVVMDGCRMAFKSGSLGAVVLTNVFHHVPDPSAFLSEAARCLAPGGLLVMVEPWITSWSRLVYRTLHHEPVDTTASWALASGGPLTAANSALPWIVFQRDRAAFERRHPELELLSVRPTMPFRYLVSGGVSRRSLAPGWSVPVWRAIERVLEPFMAQLAMFAVIVVRRRAVGGREIAR